MSVTSEVFVPFKNKNVNGMSSDPKRFPMPCSRDAVFFGLLSTFVLLLRAIFLADSQE